MKNVRKKTLLTNQIVTITILTNHINPLNLLIRVKKKEKKTNEQKRLCGFFLFLFFLLFLK